MFTKNKTILRDLGNGLAMRRSTPGDADALAEFNAKRAGGVIPECATKFSDKDVTVLNNLCYTRCFREDFLEDHSALRLVFDCSNIPDSNN